MNIDTSFFGALNEYSAKIAYFFHTCLQATACYAGTVEGLRAVSEAGLEQGLLADGQCFTVGQLQRCLKQQDSEFEIDPFFPPGLRVISADKRVRKPSDTLFKAALQALGEKGVKPSEVLHVGSNLARDLAPAKKHGFRTALFAGDKGSLSATPEQLKDPAYRPDVLLTELPQVLEVIG